MGTGRLGVVSGRASLTSARRDSRTSSPRSDDGQRTRDVLDRLADVVRRFHGSGTCWDQQIPLERAFAAPHELTRRLGQPLDAEELAKYDPDALGAIFSQVPALHRFPGSMAKRVQALCQLVVDTYDGDAARVWTTAVEGKELLKPVAALPGFGQQKASIFVALLGKQLGVTPSGWREACEPFGEEGSYRSVADITSPESRIKVRSGPDVHLAGQGG